MTVEEPLRLALNGRFMLQDVTGVQRVAIEITRALDELAVESEGSLEAKVCLPSTGEIVTELDLQAVRVQRGGRLVGHAWEQVELPGMSRGWPLLCLGNVAPLRRLVRRRPATYTMVHDLSYRYFPAAYRRRFRYWYGLAVPLAINQSSAVFTVSNSERQAILSAYPRLARPSRLLALQNGGGEASVSATVTDSAQSLQPGCGDVPSRRLRRRSCLYVGSLTKRKNGAMLLRAATALLRQDSDLSFDVVGATQGNLSEVGLDVPADIAQRVRFHGQVNEPGVVESLYRRSMLLVFPSLYEASPLPPIESMSLGCPVVVSDIPSLRERCGDSAAYCDPSDINSIVEEVGLMLADESRWSDMQRSGLFWAGRFAWRGQARSLLAEIRAFQRCASR